MDPREPRRGPTNTFGRADTAEALDNLAKVTRARDTLNRIDRLRATAIGHQLGRTDHAISDLLNVPVETVQRTIRRLQLAPPPTDPTATEIICRATVGELERTTMITMLNAFDFTYGQHDPGGSDAYRRGTWDEIEHAVGQGLLTEDEYAFLGRPR